MESRRKRSRSQLLKWGCYVLALFVCAALQTTPGLFQLGQAKPLLLLPLCLAVAVFEGEFAGALLGTVGGLLWDYAAGRTVGMLALELLLLCFGVSVLVQLYLQVNPGNFAAVSTATALVVLSLDWLFFYEVERVFNLAEAEGLTGMGITHYIEEYIDLANVLRTSSREWDGGYVICGLTGSGESFAIRDPWGIRPAFWYQDDEIAVLASERPVIQTALNVPFEEIKELQPGQALLISKEGKIRTSQINKPRENHACSFERIYFSRGSDVDIYKERKRLGEKLVPRILKAINNDIDHTVFSFIPNTAEVAFYGMLQGLDDYLNEEKVQQIAALGHHPDMEELEVILSRRIRSEKVAIKDIKLRTFIAEGNSRNDLAAHVYDITYGSLVPGVDNLVIIDDSIVRGTTLKQSIIGILDRLGPKKIVIVSSSPQVRYPDYYGIDMAKMSEFIAFRAAVELLKERDMKDVIAAAYRKSKDQVGLPKEQMINYVKDIYAPFTDEEISGKMVELLTPKGTKAKVEIVYQPLEGLHEACPHHKGDWYFSGNYPTPGGVKMVNRAFIDYIEQMYQF